MGQDISERTGQLAGNSPRFSLAKSHRAFSPIGPWITTIEELEELDDPTDLALACTLDEETVQSGRTRDLIFSGTPSGVGFSRTPPAAWPRATSCAPRSRDWGH
ncbi:fumarylacetoacetate hydrolase family protein [Streptomyces sp. NPDC058464]|uniref:fumarylacetoacetate hydrolase family protein n=1 Tax=Streptomyces sp. NPDC058464 TaxID=3346511 RepID=UPI003650959A